MPDPEKEELKDRIEKAKVILKGAEKDLDSGKAIDTKKVISKTIGVLG